MHRTTRKDSAPPPELISEPFFSKTCLKALTLLEPQSRFGDKPVKFQVVCPRNGTAVLKGLRRLTGAQNENGGF